MFDHFQFALIHGHKETETGTHNAHSNGKRKEQHEPNLGKPQFQSSPAAEKCKFLRKDLHHLLKHTDFPGGSDGKVYAYNSGDLGSILGWGRSSGEGNGNPLQYSCLENPTGEAC